MLDFWRWSSSDILSNTLRGRFAEYIVATDVGCDGDIRYEWDAYDLKMRGGAKIEVKSSSYWQSWEQNGLSKISFGIQPTRIWDESKNKRSQNSERQADVYVFCVLAHKEEKTLDQFNMDQWDFYVLPAKVLDDEVGDQKTITLGSLLTLEGTDKLTYCCSESGNSGRIKNTNRAPSGV
jgi:hypothetical protein